MAEYIYEIEHFESDESEVFNGYIRKHSQRLVRCKDCIKKDLCCLYRDIKDENGFCKWAAQVKR